MAPFGRPCFTEGHVSPKSSRGGLVLGEGSEAQVRLDDGHLGEELLSLLALDGRVDNDVVTCDGSVRLYFLVVISSSSAGVLTRDPVDRGGDAVLVASLERVDNAEDLSGVAASAGGVREDGADGLLGVDDEDGTDGESDALLVDVGGVLVVDPGLDCEPVFLIRSG